MEAIHKEQAEKVREKAVQEQKEAKKEKDKAMKEKKAIQGARQGLLESKASRKSSQK